MALISEDALDALATLGEEAPLDVMLTALNDSFTGVRRAAVRALRQLKGHVSPSVLTVALRNGDGYEREYVVEQLELWSEPSVIPILLSCLDDPEKDVREQAVKAMTTLSEYVVLEDILPFVEARSSSTRSAALELLARLKKPVPMDLLRQALIDPASGYVSQPFMF
ncbi:HEAT repeat domain-containing protein [Dictyobacter kobayashii]|nr:HEAT repeat domain-containing protein [Dictyobacter kobayashii]